MLNINDDKFFYRNSTIDGIPRIGMENDNFLLYHAFSLIGNNDNEYTQKEFIHVDLEDNYTKLVVRLSVFRIIRTKNN